MKEIVVVSGKGGTGKTSIAASLAALAERPVLADCDVDAADLHLILSPSVRAEYDFSGGKRAKTVSAKCAGCGQCVDLCRFDAVHLNGPANTSIRKTCAVDPIMCEGCGVCNWFCPQRAVEFSTVKNGKWFVSTTRFGPMVHARLGIAEANSGKLVTIVRQNARRIAEQEKAKYLLVDGPPGIGCPVIASITGADLVLIVTEPTLSGKHDLERVADLAKHFNIPAMVCINKYDINGSMADAIEDEAESRGLVVAGRIRYDESVTRAQIMKTTVVEYMDGPATEQILKLWRGLA